MLALLLSVVLNSMFTSLVGLVPQLVNRPSIAQLVERWTVVVWTSIGRWFESGSKDFFFALLQKQFSQCEWRANILAESHASTI